MSSGANDQAKVLQFAAFRDHGWDMLHCIQDDHMFFIAKLFQPPHNDFGPTAEKLRKIF